MAVRFPDEPGFADRYAPMRLEGEICGLEVTHGAVPDTLRGGRVCRCGGGWRQSARDWCGQCVQRTGGLARACRRLQVRGSRENQ
jgi:hypothetical protein